MADAVGGYSAAVGYFALFEAEGFAVGDELGDEFAVEAVGGHWFRLSCLSVNLGMSAVMLVGLPKM